MLRHGRPSKEAAPGASSLGKRPKQDSSSADRGGARGRRRFRPRAFRGAMTVSRSQPGGATQRGERTERHGVVPVQTVHLCEFSLSKKANTVS